jgi:glycosyltransferase involved in cell wall biosynthesis
MKIGIDARFLSHTQAGGFKTYTENLVEALTVLDTQHEYVLYTDRKTMNLKRPLPRNFKVRVVSGVVSGMGMPLREQVLLPLCAWLDGVEVFHSPCLTAPLRLHCPLVVTMHDMIWHWPNRFASATLQSPKRRMQTSYYRTYPKWAAKRAQAIITVSQSAEMDLHKELHVPLSKLFVTLEAAPLHCHRVTDEAELARVREKFKLTPGYIMAIGSADPRKNILRLIDAYSKLSETMRQRFPLAIVWTHAFLSAEAAKWVEERNLVGQVRFLEWASNEDMYALYSMAGLFVFPSRYEGFGLPLLEAMVCGAPVAAANNSSIPEVAGDAAVMFDAEVTDEMTEVLAQVLSDEALRKDLVEKGYRRAKLFSWERCARETISVYDHMQGTPTTANALITRLLKGVQQTYGRMNLIRAKLPLSRFTQPITQKLQKTSDVSPVNSVNSVISDNTAL